MTSEAGRTLARKRWDNTKPFQIRCAWCNQRRHVRHPNAVYCSDNCRWNAANKRRKTRSETS